VSLDCDLCGAPKEVSKSVICYRCVAKSVRASTLEEAVDSWINHPDPSVALRRIWEARKRERDR